MDGWMDGWMDGHIYTYVTHMCIYTCRDDVHKYARTYVCKHHVVVGWGLGLWVGSGFGKVWVQDV